MRKIIFALLILICLVSCNEDTVLETLENHTCDFKCGRLVESAEPTCDFPGYKLWACKYEFYGCNHTKIEQIDAYGDHDMKKIQTDRVGDHDETIYRCSRCNYTERTQEHKVDEGWKCNKTAHWHEYTCGCTGEDKKALKTGYEEHVFSVQIGTAKKCAICGVYLIGDSLYSEADSSVSIVQ